LKVVVERTKFWTFFASQIIRRRFPQISYVRYHPNLEIQQVPKFRQATPSESEVISASLLHFKPIFDLSFKKIVRKASVPVGGALVRLGHFLVSVKIWKRSTP